MIVITLIRVVVSLREVHLLVILAVVVFLANLDLLVLVQLRWHNIVVELMVIFVRLP